MTNTNPEFAAAAKTQLEAAIRIATVTSESIGRLFELNLKTARASLDEVTAQARAIAAAKDPAEIQAIAGKVLKPNLDKSQSYAREVYDSVSGIQGEVAAVLENQVTEFQKQIVVALDGLLKNAPAGSEVIVSSVKTAVSSANQAYETAVQSWRGATAAFEPATAATAKRKTAA